ncbi:PACE efflux transporter [Aggregatibacter kilianii]|uniref:PACE efflux transporter n=1 Tax=Aggregatibacter kilianii TaxID=2025884 RepID=UPI000D64854F|nr:PACE efflux transporter [Aggregatibacter kilianii]
MQVKERLLHTVLFELGAIIVTVIAVSLVGGELHSAIGLSVAISVVAMGCNFGFNWLFDKIFTGRRELRGFGVRLLHTVSFETALMLLTLPMLMYALGLTLWEALLMDISLTLIIMIYTFLFNWAYDHLRLFFVRE